MKIVLQIFVYLTFRSSNWSFPVTEGFHVEVFSECMYCTCKGHTNTCEVHVIQIRGAVDKVFETIFDMFYLVC